jgi:hypothetical protein
MTTRARAALADCELALSDFSASAGTSNVQTRWVALITLLRIVLDVLEKVDGKASAPARQRIHAARKQLFENKPEPRIFHDFIEDERNDTVHQYEIGAAVNITIRLGSVWMNVNTGEGGSSPSGPATYDFVMRDGAYEGQDPRVVARKAIEFWRTYLDAIDSGAAA